MSYLLRMKGGNVGPGHMDEIPMFMVKVAGVLLIVAAGQGKKASWSLLHLLH